MSLRRRLQLLFRSFFFFKKNVPVIIIREIVACTRGKKSWIHTEGYVEAHFYRYWSGVAHRDENKSRHAFQLYFCIASGSRAIYACNERRKLEDGSSHGRTWEILTPFYFSPSLSLSTFSPSRSCIYHVRGWKEKKRRKIKARLHFPAPIKQVVAG